MYGLTLTCPSCLKTMNFKQFFVAGADRAQAQLLHAVILVVRNGWTPTDVPHNTRWARPCQHSDHQNYYEELEKRKIAVCSTPSMRTGYCGAHFLASTRYVRPK